MSDNMTLYNAVRTPPPEALREIKAGRLAGKSDINPMWRIKALTEQFGPCGEGWKYTIERLWTEQGANGEIAAFALINLYHKIGEGWSEPIPGIGGNSFVAKEKKRNVYQRRVLQDGAHRRPERGVQGFRRCG